MGAQNRPKMTHKLGKPDNTKNTLIGARDRTKIAQIRETPRTPIIPQRDTSPRRGESAKKGAQMANNKPNRENSTDLSQINRPRSQQQKLTK